MFQNSIIEKIDFFKYLKTNYFELEHH